MTSKKNSKKGPRPRKAGTRPASRIRRTRTRTKAGAPTLGDVAKGYLAHIEQHGKTKATIASYRADLGVALRHLGAETPAAGITAKQVAAFNASAAVTKTRDGKAKAKPGVDKTRRVLRLALVWAAGAGLIETAPIPEPSTKA